MLAELYSGLGHVEIVGALRDGINDIWSPIKNSFRPLQLIDTKDNEKVISQVIDIVLENPYDIVHLSQPESLNIIIGLLYQLVWGAYVFVDIIDNNAGGSDTEDSKHRNRLQHTNPFQIFQEVCSETGTLTALECAQAFDGTTTINTVLQQRHGGVIIRQAFEHKMLRHFMANRVKLREHYCIGSGHRVIIVFGDNYGLTESSQLEQFLCGLDGLKITLILIQNPNISDQVNTPKPIANTSLNIRCLEPWILEQIPGFVACADILIILPDEHRTADTQNHTPMILSQALAIGIPVLAVPYPGINDLVDVEACIAVSGGNLFAALHQALSNLPILSEITPNHNLAEKLSIEVNRSQLTALLEPARERYLSTKLRQMCTQGALGPLLEELGGRVKIIAKASRPASFRDGSKAGHQPRKETLDLLSNDLEKLTQQVSRPLHESSISTSVDRGNPHPSPKTSIDYSKIGINLVGHASSLLGLGMELRQMANALHEYGFPFCIHDIPTKDSGPLPPVLAPYLSDTLQYPISLFCMSPFTYGRLMQRDESTFKNTYHIGNFFWELHDFPNSWSHVLDSVNEIWVPTRFVQDIFRRMQRVEVSCIPSPASPPERCAGSLRDRLGVSPDAFVFGFMFDCQSTFTRKNPQGLIRAYQIMRSALPTHRKTALIIKYHRTRQEHLPALNRLKELARHSNDIIIFEHTLPHRELGMFYNTLDAYVSLHRSEGLGRTLIEAAQWGLPVICTRYSGSDEVVELGLAQGVEYRLIPCRAHDYPYCEGSIWAEPDILHAAHLMRQCVLNKSQHTPRENLLHKLSEHFSGKIFAERVRGRVELIRRNTLH
jgi:glycosyltransferase involved in cell wall biosynthesis